MKIEKHFIYTSSRLLKHFAWTGEGRLFFHYLQNLKLFSVKHPKTLCYLYLKDCL